MCALAEAPTYLEQHSPDHTPPHVVNNNIQPGPKIGGLMEPPCSPAINTCGITLHLITFRRSFYPSDLGPNVEELITTASAMKQR